MILNQEEYENNKKKSDALCKELGDVVYQITILDSRKKELIKLIMETSQEGSAEID